MAKRADGAASGLALADKESGMAEATAGDTRGQNRQEQSPAFDGRPGQGGPAPAAARRSFFDIYKPGQGYYTRLWSGISAGVLICWFAAFLYTKFELVGEGTTTRYIQVGVAVATIVVFGLLCYWLLAINRKVCDFMIATEGEMKKVNWTSRKDIIGSTKVVVFVVVAMSILLFVVDLFFMLFFNQIGILKGAGLLDAFRELF